MRAFLFQAAAIVLSAGISATLFAQSISFGVKGGAPLTHAAEGGAGVHPEDRRYTIGPMIEIALPRHFAFEVDALYRRIGYSFVSPAIQSDGFTVRYRANSWEFPLVAKFYVLSKALPFRTYLDGGYVLRRVTGAHRVVELDPAFRIIGPFEPGQKPTHGMAAGGGVRFVIGRLRLTQEVRYTRWIGTVSFGAIQSAQHQAELLMGLSF